MPLSNEGIYMYSENDNLPEEGWLHGCTICESITGNTYTFSIGYLIRYDIDAYICRNCCKNKKNLRKLISKAPKFIKNRWIYPF